VDLGPAGGWREIRGAEAVAGEALAFSGIGLVVHRALVNGVAGAVSTLDGEPFSLGAVTVRNGKIVEMDILADPDRLRGLDLTILED
jgi:RNA polymerase sigma-70 factor (ECF subfamily)